MQKQHFQIVILSVFLSGCGLSTDGNLAVKQVASQQYQKVQSQCTCPVKKTPTVVAAVKPKTAADTTKTTTVTPAKDTTKIQVASETAKATIPSTNTATKKTPLEYIIEKVKDADSKALITQVEMFTKSKGDYKDGKKTSQVRETFVTGKMTVKKPSSIMINISDSDDSMAKGSSLLYTGVGKVKVKAGGVLSLIPVSFDITDPKLTNSRNQKLTDLNEHIRRLTASGAQLKLLGTSTISGRKVYMIRNEKPKISDTEVTYEVFGIDAENFLLMSNEMYLNEEMVSQYLVKSLVLNPNIGDNFFTL